MSSTPDEHKAHAPKMVGCAVVTVTDTRTAKTDTGGATIAKRLTGAGHRIVRREIVPDDPEKLRALLESLFTRSDVEAILLTGGTGVASRDHTFETVNRVIERPMPGYGELFRMLSYEQVGPACMLSRAFGGVVRDTLILTMPGSVAAVELAMDKIILPELSHIVGQLKR